MHACKNTAQLGNSCKLWCAEFLSGCITQGCWLESCDVSWVPCGRTHSPVSSSPDQSPRSPPPPSPGPLMTGTIFLAWAACILGYLIRTNDVRVHCFHITSLPHYHELSGVIQRAHNPQQKYHSRNPYEMASTSRRQGQRGRLYFVQYRNSTDFRAKHLPTKHAVPCRKQPKTETPTKPSTQFLGHFI